MGKSRKLKLHSQGQEALTEQKESFSVPVSAIRERLSPISLAHVRTEAVKLQTDTAHTIADLEAWRAEIDATIAFLKARSK